jgi:UPF0755 protein
MLNLLQRIIKLLLLILIVINLCLAYYLSKTMNTPSEKKSGSNLLLIEKGQSPRSIARTLKKNELIKDALAFHFTYSTFYAPRFLRAGEYEFSLPIEPRKIMLDLISGKVLLHPLTIPEGLTFNEIGELLVQKKYSMEGSFFEACHKKGLIADLDAEASNLEGYLFPETYYFPREVKAEEMVRAMVEQFKRNFGDKEKERTQQLRMSLREIVTLASMIEKETSRPEEKSLVSAVFHNRLQFRMKLDCDPSIIYALKLQNRFDGNLKLKDKSLNSPYNTYLYPGLPPGPICNPGKESLLAALYPAEVDYLYFVSRKDGSHVFNRSYNEHLKAIKKFQLNQLKNKSVLR